jgi:hypothetical protein
MPCAFPWILLQFHFIYKHSNRRHHHTA